MGSGLDRVVGNGAAWGSSRIRVGPWHGDERVGYLAPVGEAPAPGVTDVRNACERLARSGFAEVITAAIGPLESQGFLLAGFEVHERLHLLERDLRDLRDLPHSPPASLRRARRRDRSRVLEVDAAAFSDFWRLDEAGLDEALSATPTSRFRVGLSDAAGVGGVGGYAICGRAGRRGFLQRLAVDPAAQGAGLGRSLVLDGLAWLRRRGAERVVVNTQEANARALQLYEQLGFRRQAGGLAVLKKSL